MMSVMQIVASSYNKRESIPIRKSINYKMFLVRTCYFNVLQNFTQQLAAYSKN